MNHLSKVATSDSVRFRFAIASDLSAIVELVASEVLNPLESLDAKDRHRYEAAFAEISERVGNHLLLAEDDSGVLGMLQLALDPTMNFKGSSEAMIEILRVRSGARRRGIGSSLVRIAIEMAKESDCAFIQLRTEPRHVDAIRFCERIGFAPSQFGMKLSLRSPSTEQVAW